VVILHLNIRHIAIHQPPKARKKESALHHPHYKSQGKQASISRDQGLVEGVAPKGVFDMSNNVKNRLLIFAGVLLFAAGAAVAQDFPKVEMAPGFSYQHNSPVLGGSQGFNCAGGGSTMAINITSMFGLAADLSGCKIFGLDNTYGVGSKVGGSEFTYVFGPRLTF
jgi:hypothetical protein